jgi:polygalacturonase
MIDVRAYGAAGNGCTLDTPALQAAIDACHTQGGGTVNVPAGRYVTGAIFLRDDITLHLEAGAILLGSEDLADYPIINGRWEGAEQSTYASLITGANLRNIAVTGRGAIDGRGAHWWRRFTDKTLAHPRPRLIAFANCDNVLIEGITAINSPSWTINPVRCENVTIHGVSIINPADSPNTDGINPDSCRLVHISDCYVSVGDDCVTIKSGVETEDADQRAPCENVTITNCTMAHGHGGVVIGSEMSGGVRNVVISNCVFIGTDRGLRFKSRRGRGGVVEDIRISNIVMTDVLCPITLNLYYACGAWGDTVVSDKQPHPVTADTPQFRRIHFSHITARDAKYAAAFLYGLAEMPVEDITLSDITISLSPDAAPGYPEMADDMDLMQRAGFFVRNARGLRLHQVEISGQTGAAFHVIDSSEVELSGCATRTPDLKHPIVQLDNVDHAFVHGCRANSGAPVFLQVDGERSADIVLRGNRLSCPQPVALGAAVQADTVQSDEILWRTS